MKVSYTKGYYAPIPEDHVFPMRKFEGLRTYLLENNIIQNDDIIEPELAPESLLLLNHTREYVDKILYGTLSKKEERKLGLPWSLGLANRSRYAVQGTLNASQIALKEGCAANLAGGTHHAMPDYGEGFCVFNDVAIAIKYLLSNKLIKKALVIDLDVHQGNGTAHSFANDPNVITVSLHGHKNYPFSKPKSTIDIGLPDKTDDELYLALLSDTLEQINTQEIDILFYLAGIDVLETDRFGRIAISYEGLQKRDLIICQFAKNNHIPLCLLLSGGYAPTLNETILAHASAFKALKSVF
jgi:acetoin utilization deacetylase AcuC-like enzyme